jgi:hypothetical protein
MDGCKSIYGINLNENITPIMVRDAIVECYYQADIEVLNKLFYESDYDSEEDEKKTKREHVEIMLKKMFNDINGDYNNPTKESLLNVIDKCKDFAKCFRDEEIIKKHYNEILELINRIE